jgi:hypothetical protein
LLSEGTPRVNPANREMLLTAFRLALQDAFENRKRNADGDYRQDPKAECFPAFEATPSTPPPKASAGAAKAPLTGILEDWSKEAKAGGPTISTYEKL